MTGHPCPATPAVASMTVGQTVFVRYIPDASGFLDIILLGQAKSLRTNTGKNMTTKSTVAQSYRPKFTPYTLFGRGAEADETSTAEKTSGVNAARKDRILRWCDV